MRQLIKLISDYTASNYTILFEAIESNMDYKTLRKKPFNCRFGTSLFSIQHLSLFIKHLPNENNTRYKVYING